MNGLVFVLTTSIFFIKITSERGECHTSLCTWENWEEWSSCSRTCGGGGSKYRSRVLCCKAKFVPDNADACAIDCNMHDYVEWQYLECGGLCLGGGRLKNSGFGCDCFERSYGQCCEESKYLNI